MQLATTVTVVGGDQERYVASEWLEVPSAEELIASKLEVPAYWRKQATRREGLAGPAGGAEG